MNTRTAGSAITPKAYTTIGAGVRAEEIDYIGSI